MAVKGVLDFVKGVGGMIAKCRTPGGTIGWVGGETGVFQWLEKKFPMVGKFWPIFPTIGKIFLMFSNDWKKFSVSHKGHKEHKDCGRDAGGEREESYKNGEKTALRTGMFLEGGWRETTWTTRDNFLQGAPPERAAD